MTGNRNAAKGAHYKRRTKKWLIAQGYQVADLEVIRWVHKPGGQRIPVKRDQFASDLLAVGQRVIFVQVKGGEAARTGHFPDAVRAFAAFTFPDSVHRWIVAWAPRVREPRVITIVNPPPNPGELHGKAEKEVEAEYNPLTGLPFYHADGRISTLVPKPTSARRGRSDHRGDRSRRRAVR